MYFGEALRFSLQALRANKFRSFLTALGLIIGNASVILVVTISITSRDYILDLIRGFGSNLIYAQYSAGTANSTKADADFIKAADVEAVRQQFGSRIVAATGISFSMARWFVFGQRPTPTSASRIRLKGSALVPRATTPCRTQTAVLLCRGPA